jgi:dGTPase
MKRMTWDALLDQLRVRELLSGTKSSTVSGESRTEFERDRDRSVYASPFRRLMGKTQVFPLDPNDYVRTRLVHSLEVSTVSEGLAAQATRGVIRKKENHLTTDQERAIAKVAETCGLLHDIGNPPFGHAGELAIASWFTDREAGRDQMKKLGSERSQAASDFGLFEGNAQTFRILTNTRLLTHNYGLNLTCATTSAIRKYLAPSHKADRKSTIHEKTKPGFFLSEETILQQISAQTSTEDRRHPITFLVEAADDIVYCVVDIEDGIKKDLLTWQQVSAFLEKRCDASPVFNEAIKGADKQMRDVPKESALWSSEYPQAFRVYAISAMVRAVVKIFDLRYDAIMAGKYHEELVYDEECDAASFVEACKDLLRETVFRDQDILRLEVRGREVIHDLMDLFWEGVSDYLRERKTHTRTYGGKLYLLISTNYRHVFEQRLRSGKENEIYCAVQLVTDYVSGMTDGYACRLHTDLMNGRIN